MKDHRLVIIGAGGQGKVLADIALKNGYSRICFLDDNAAGECLGFPILGGCALIPKLNDGQTDFVIAVGNNRIRKRIAEQYDANWIPLIHPAACIASDVTIGDGTVIMAGAVVNVSARIGRHCIINTNAVVEHDNVMEDFVHLSPGGLLGGTVHVGTLTHIGIGAAVRNNLNICPECMIGAGAVVVKNLECSGTYVGIPAKELL